MRRPYRTQRGFTLVELIVTLTILALVSVGIFGFIDASATGYAAARDREVLQSQARFAVERLGRELRHAVPNSLLVSEGGQCLTYTPITYTGIYGERQDNTNQLQVAMSTQDADWQSRIDDGRHRIVFLPTKPQDLIEGSANSFAITAVEGDVLTTSKNVAQSWPVGSSSSRFYVYRDAVTFCFEQGELSRRVNQGDARFVTLAKNLAGGSYFSVDSQSLSGGNLISIFYRFRQSGEISAYNQQVQVLNAP